MALGHLGATGGLDGVVEVVRLADPWLQVGPLKLSKTVREQRKPMGDGAL